MLKATSLLEAEVVLPRLWLHSGCGGHCVRAQCALRSLLTSFASPLRRLAEVPVCVVGGFLNVAECSYMVYCLLVPSIGSARQHPVYAMSVFWVGVESTLVRAKIGVVSSHNK